MCKNILKCADSYEIFIDMINHIEKMEGLYEQWRSAEIAVKT